MPDQNPPPDPQGNGGSEQPTAVEEDYAAIRRGNTVKNVGLDGFNRLRKGEG